MSAKPSTHGKGRRALESALHNRETFKTSGSLRGERVDLTAGETPWAGRMPHDEVLTMGLNSSMRNGIHYIVFSYDTPIGFVYGDGSVDIPSASYSVTTSRHQGIVRVHLP